MAAEDNKRFSALDFCSACCSSFWPPDGDGVPGGKSRMASAVMLCFPGSTTGWQQRSGRELELRHCTGSSVYFGAKEPGERKEINKNDKNGGTQRK